MQKFIAIATLVAASATLASANAVSGSLSFVLVNVSGNNSNLSTTTLLVSTDSLTEAPGSGDFAGVPVLTSFGPTTLSESTIGTGGGFMVSNASWGSFVADSASLTTRIPTFLNIDMIGTFTPGPSLPGESPTPAVAHLTYDQTGPALSGAFTLETTAVPETTSMALLGSGLVLCGLVRMRKT